MTLDPLLVEILVCPEDKGFLYYLPDQDILYNPRLRRRYPIESGIPVMLVEEAQLVDEEEHRRIMARVAAGEAKPTWKGPEEEAGSEVGERT